jgi:hypothetical protein
MSHPITPPPELFNKLKEEWAALGVKIRGDLGNYLVNNAYRIGADQELDTCCEYVYERLKLTTAACIAQELRAARRPKPPSLKEQALQALSEAVKMADDVPPEGICSGQADIIRRALEALPE